MTRINTTLRCRVPTGLAALATVVLTASTLGCEIFDVVNNLNKDTKPKQKPIAEEASAPAGSNTQSKLKAYYDREATKTVEHDPNDPIVNCRVRGSSQFMRRHDCTLRGGAET